MEKNKEFSDFNLPACAVEYIKLVVKKMKWRKSVRADVQAELIGHFEDAIRDCKTNEEKEKKAKELIENFGDAKLIANLARRAKKRCRPMWVKALIVTAQIIGIIILFIIIRSLPMYIGSPTISVNYAEWLNEKVRAGRDESLNAKPFYDKAISTFVEQPKWLQEIKTHWPGDFNEQQLGEFKIWYDKNKDSFEALRQGSAKPAYWNIYDTNEPNMLAVLEPMMKHLGGFRRIAQNIWWKVKYDIYNNDFNSATAGVIALIKLGQQMHGQGTLVEQLVGISIEAMGIGSIFENRNAVQWPEEKLREIQIQLEQYVNNPVITLDSEKAFMYDYIQQSFTDDGHGNGRILKKGIPIAFDNWQELVKDFFITGFPDRQQTIEKIESLYELSEQRFSKTLFELKNEPLDKPLEHSEKNPFLLATQVSLANKKLIELTWRLKTERDGQITTIAIVRYHKQTGKYPDSLEELLNKGFIKRIPFDAYKNGEMTYKKIGDSFTLYSFSNNFKDDSGDDTFGKWKDKGDTVFWPVKTK
ncbi:MAG: hypothetical protein WC770_02565 [Phycisphaerae bacterium]|jgi:hypothetical protein